LTVKNIKTKPFLYSMYSITPKRIASWRTYLFYMRQGMRSVEVEAMRRYWCGAGKPVSSDLAGSWLELKAHEASLY